MKDKTILLSFIVSLTIFSNTFAAPTLLPNPNVDSFYYEIGGGTGFRITGGVEVPQELQMMRDFGLLIGDGNFNPLDSIKSTLQGLLNGLAGQFENKVKGLLSIDNFTAQLGLMPGNIFCQANPTACQLHENYTIRAEEKEKFQRRFYEKMEGELSEARGKLDGWLAAGKANHMVKVMNDAKVSSEKDLELVMGKIRDYTGNQGLKWIGGVMAGGNNQPPIRPVADTVKAGFNYLLGRPPTATGVASGQDPILDYWDTPEEAAKWLTEVVGEYRPDLNNVHTQSSLGGIGAGSDDGDFGTGAEDVVVTSSFLNSDMSTPALGLSPKVRKESYSIQSKLFALTHSTTAPTNEELTQLMGSSSGMVITKGLIDILKNSPIQEVLIKQIGDDAARANVIHLALESRRILLAGRNENHIASYEVATKEIDMRANRLKEYIDDLMYERRIRRELLSDTFEKILEQNIELTEKSSLAERTLIRKKLGEGGVNQ